MSVRYQSSGPELVPPASPAVREWMLHTDPAFGEATFDDMELPAAYLANAVAWTERLLSVLRAWRDQLLLTDYPMTRNVGVGFLDPEHEVDAFGVVLYSAGLLTDAEHRLSEEPMEVERLSERAAHVARVGPVELLETAREWREIGGRPLMVSLRPADEELHNCAVPRPKSGTPASFARTRCSNVGTPPLEGVLTCKHIVNGTPLGVSLGAAVNMASGQVEAVVDMAPDPIDAILVSSPMPASLAPRATNRYVAQYQPVEIRTHRRSIPTLVTMVTDSMNIWGDTDIPVYIETEDPGSAGDSGSLVVDETDRPIGLYRGVVNAVTPPRNYGRAAHIRQLEVTMDMELLQ